ncbi:hypothetical protein OEZ86_005689 [Tetradesmus obliquus]|nr:hypothetical protein OEZ86_005689 [Tetradesmus obliquus]
MQARCLQRRQAVGGNRHHAAVAAAARSRAGSLKCHASVVWRQLEGTKAWVAHPRAARVSGVIHFLGGAFAGAAPQLLYNGFIEQLADAGYTTIATPYAVTFRHDQCAKAVRQTFLDSVAELRRSGRSYLTPQKAPCFGVGHSNGALLHLLIGSLEPAATQANVIISYNNLQVSDAIPIPGFLEGLQPTLQAARSMSSTDETGSSSSSSSGSSSALPGLALPQLSAQQVLVAAAATAPVLSLEQRQLLAGAAPALDQLASVINEVGDGLTDFRPTPEESRALIAAGYSCPATLLVQFEDDKNFDETPEMQQILSARFASLSSSGHDMPADEGPM